MVQGSGFKVSDLGIWVKGSGFGVECSGLACERGGEQRQDRTALRHRRAPGSPRLHQPSQSRGCIPACSTHMHTTYRIQGLGFRV